MISRRLTTLKSLATLSVLLLPLSISFGQAPAGPPPGSPDIQQTGPLLSPEQLDNLVAPVALYPDPLLSTVLAASTYPLEIVEAQQWLQQNGNLRGAPLMDAAKQQNWDPSVQALVALPDALRLLSNDIRWTTDLGNAFLAQQADVMSAVQRMRARARANGRLATTPQQVVTTEVQDGQSAIEIQPADPQVVYVPVYQPAYVWGPPAWGAYPDLWYPSGFGFGFGFGPGIYIGSLFPGWGGWGGWGWGFGWFGHNVFVNGGFFNRYGFRGGFGGGRFGGGGFGGRALWAHAPSHRMGVPYANGSVANRFNASRVSGGAINRGQFGGNRALGAGANSSRSASAAGSRSFNGNRTATNSYQGRQPSQSYRAPAQSYRGGYNNASAYRSAPSYNRSYGGSYSAPRSQSYGAYNNASSYRSAPSYNRSYGGGNSAPRAQSFSAPRSSGGGHSGFSGGHSGGGHSGGGGHSSGGHSGGGSHHR
jgi:hypothetical protein